MPTQTAALRLPNCHKYNASIGSLYSGLTQSKCRISVVRLERRGHEWDGALLFPCCRLSTMWYLCVSSIAGANCAAQGHAYGDAWMDGSSQAFPAGLHTLWILLVCSTISDQRAPYEPRWGQAGYCHAVWPPGFGEHRLLGLIQPEHALVMHHLLQCLWKTLAGFNVFCNRGSTVLLDGNPACEAERDLERWVRTRFWRS